MKPKHGLPCGVRLIAGLGGAGGTAVLALAAETLDEPERRATLCIGVVLTSRSVPELSPIRYRFSEAEGGAFAAVQVLEPNPIRYRLCVRTLGLPIHVAVRCRADSPAQSLALNSEQAV